MPLVSFDLSMGLQAARVLVQLLPAKLHNVFVCNNGTETVWVKISDAATLRHNLAVPATRTRDLILPDGELYSRLYFHATTEQSHTSDQSPAPNTVYLSGCYELQT